MNEEYVTRLQNGKNPEKKTWKKNRTDSTNECHNQGFNLKHKTEDEIAP